jgi:hypothetical protein
LTTRRGGHLASYGVAQTGYMPVLRPYRFMANRPLPGRNSSNLWHLEKPVAIGDGDRLYP